jgi:hypothetical protein
MNLNEIIEEIYDTGYGKQYPAYSAPPRKDFGPNSNASGYSNPYQRDGVYGNLGDPSMPDGMPCLPWPLQTLSVDVADSFVFLASGMSKIYQCLKQNPSIDKKSKEELLEIYKQSKSALKIIKDIGMSIEKLNMSKPQPPQNPIDVAGQKRAESDSIPNINPTIAIKLP